MVLVVAAAAAVATARLRVPLVGVRMMVAVLLVRLVAGVFVAALLLLLWVIWRHRGRLVAVALSVVHVVGVLVVVGWLGWRWTVRGGGAGAGGSRAKGAVVCAAFDVNVKRKRL